MTTTQSKIKVPPDWGDWSKRRKFAFLYHLTMDGAEAALNAGYPLSRIRNWTNLLLSPSVLRELRIFRQISSIDNIRDELEARIHDMVIAQLRRIRTLDDYATYAEFMSDRISALRAASSLTQDLWDRIGFIRKAEMKADITGVTLASFVEQYATQGGDDGEDGGDGDHPALRGAVPEPGPPMEN